ncbi:glutaredoxin domain-containing protein [Cellulosimicrobium sp. TH-20]|uniref:glutaredoxin domain-containing protein n=1 Tax=Cellulosimicrobium sp. TH-20 TaxID=1980001 RepID=UPI002714CED1|nr:glutaredoxin domain-containing protein [Cellulosimicrobium sp. TH-20]
MSAATAHDPEPMPGPDVTVYSKPDCVQCEATKRYLDRHGVEFREVDLLDVPEVADGFRAEGILAAPVVVSPVGTWGGFRPDRLRLLTA